MTYPLMHERSMFFTYYMNVDMDMKTADRTAAILDNFSGEHSGYARVELCD